MFDWISFLDSYGIEYTRKGHTANNVGIACPFCGDGKDHKYLGISLLGKGWSCWKFQKSHAGRSPYRLIIALLNCTFPEAFNIVNQPGFISFQTTDDNLLTDVYRLVGGTGGSPVVSREYLTEPLNIPVEFRPIENTALVKKLVYPYLNKRGYVGDQVIKLSKRFNLMFAYDGPFAYRIIVPITMFDDLISWTGRTITSGEQLRYLTLTTDPIRAQKQSVSPAKMNIKDTVFDYDSLLKGGDALVVTEGPFDAMRITFLGERSGIVGTCLYNKTPSLLQMELLHDVAPRFKQRYILFDKGADIEIMSQFPEYYLREYKALTLPKPYKDPAELDTYGFSKLFCSI